MTGFYRTAALALVLVPSLAFTQVQSTDTTTKSATAKDAKAKAPVKHNTGKKVSSEQAAAAENDKMQPDPLAQRNSPEPPPPTGSGISPTTPATNKTAK